MKTDPQVEQVSKEGRGVLSILVGIIALLLLGLSLFYFAGGHISTGVKSLGTSVVTFVYSTDPGYYYLDLLPPRRSRFLRIVAGIGFMLIIIGWIGDGWLFEPPKKP